MGILWSLVRAPEAAIRTAVAEVRAGERTADSLMGVFFTGDYESSDTNRKWDALLYLASPARRALDPVTDVVWRDYEAPLAWAVAGAAGLGVCDGPPERPGREFRWCTPAQVRALAAALPEGAGLAEADGYDFGTIARRPLSELQSVVDALGRFFAETAARGEATLHHL